MKLRQAMTKSIREFYAGKLPEKAIEESEGEFKYDLEFFKKLKAGEPSKAKKQDEATDEE